MPNNSRLAGTPLRDTLAAAFSPLGIFNTLQAGIYRPDVANLPYGDHPRQTLDVYLPAATDKPAPLLVWFYGGAWDSGDKRHYRFVARRFTAMGYAVAIPDYRLVPEVQFPAFVEDAAAALARLTGYAEQTERLAAGAMLLAGHSAGAYIAVQVTADPGYLAQHKVSTNRVAGIIGLAGPYDFHPYDVQASQAAFGSAPASASQPVAQDLAHMPPLLLITGDNDTTVRPRNSIKLAEAAPRAEVVKVKGASHVDVLLGLGVRITTRDAVLQPIEAFVENLISDGVHHAAVAADGLPRGA
jgi:acetyl esterase/lipase